MHNNKRTTYFELPSEVVHVEFSESSDVRDVWRHTVGLGFPTSEEKLRAYKQCFGYVSSDTLDTYSTRIIMSKASSRETVGHHDRPRILSRTPKADNPTYTRKARTYGEGRRLGTKNAQLSSQMTLLGTLALTCSTTAELARAQKVFKGISSEVNSLTSLPRMPVPSLAKFKAVVPATCGQTAASSFLTPTSSSAIIGRGFKKYVDGVTYKPGQVLTLTQISRDDWVATTDVSSIMAAVKDHLSQAEIALDSIVAHPSTKLCGTYVARIAFSSECDRDAAADTLPRLNDSHSPHSVPRVYPHRSKTTVRQVFTDPAAGVIRLLAEMPHFLTLVLPQNYTLQMLLWMDGADAQTAVKMRLIDPAGLVFHDHRSRVELIMEWIGSEHEMAHYVPELTVYLNALGTRTFTNMAGTAELHVVVSWFCADHYALGISADNPGGRNKQRDTLGNTNSDHWALLHDDGTSTFAVMNLKERYWNVMELLFDVEQLWTLETYPMPNKPPLPACMALAQKHAFGIYGRILGLGPVWFRGDYSGISR